jgi:hypothetical protein
MSKILRRPMFRGGGTVSSYGNGIATGLADGGRVELKNGTTPAWAQNADTRGYKIGTDLLRENMPQFSKSDIMNFIRENPSSANTGIFNATGLETDKEGNFYENENQYYDEKKYRPKGEDESYINYTGGFDVSESKGENQTEFEKVYRDMLTPSMDFDFQSETANDADKRKLKIESSSIEDIINESIIPNNNTTNEPYESPTMTMKQAEMNQGNVMPGVEINEGEVVIGGAGEDSGIEAMADEYFKLMGGEKARGQDISDMLLRFAGSKGDTVGEKFQNYAAEESKVKSRTEGLKEKASGFAIQQDAQMKLLQKKLDSAESIAEKNLIAAEMTALNKQYSPSITQKDINYGKSLKKGSEDHTMYLRKNKLAPTLESEIKSNVQIGTAMGVGEINALGPIYYDNWQGIFKEGVSEDDGRYLDVANQEILNFEGGKLISKTKITLTQ